MSRNEGQHLKSDYPVRELKNGMLFEGQVTPGMTYPSVPNE
ncbi:uncharacterized protein VDAG_01380 [Verticillium dahliae VdLs.17]|uniref:Uncharacterized protein n=1 Tax=Verticillium dahliae (strain VdLs.17 / ATCC MYA-4575 / FGSC 10137) TaxID=498257 RepID=G2WUA7_VERDV|nr:uncharacterized protein VDAG_01380 [Verticillium dahliae VdLs.17]EGY17698.1 hypothetical protein VDAG_01380 [Verticillium dahliae VdLs.17]